MSEGPPRAVAPRAVALDMDGVLLDSAAVHEQAFNDALAPYGLRVDYAAVAGRRTREVVDDAVRGLGMADEAVDAIVRDKQRRAVERLSRDLPVFADAAPMLARLAGRFPLALCTSASRASMENFVDGAGLAGAFAVRLCGDDVARAKPHPEVYQQACAALGVPPRDVLVVEDSSSGIAAARAAGCRVVHLDRDGRCAGSCGCRDCLPDLLAVAGLLDEAPRSPVDWGTLVIAAAGLGTRMAGTGPKALRDVAGQPMVGRIAAAFAPHCRRAVVVTRPGDEASVAQAVRDAGIGDVTPVAQAHPRGTADAVRAGLAAVSDEAAVVVWGDHLGAIRFPESWEGPAGADLPADLVLPLVRRSDPYVYFTSDPAGRPLVFHETRHGAASVADGLSDCGVFLLRPGPVVRALDALLPVEVGADINLLSLFEHMPGLGVRVETRILDDPMLTLGVNSEADLDVAVAALGLGGAA